MQQKYKYSQQFYRKPSNIKLQFTNKINISKSWLFKKKVKDQESLLKQPCDVKTNTFLKCLTFSK